MQKKILNFEDLSKTRAIEPELGGIRRDVYFAEQDSKRAVLKPYKKRVFEFEEGKEQELLEKLQPTVDELNLFHQRVQKIYEDPEIAKNYGANVNYISGVFRLVRDGQNLRLVTLEKDRRDIFPSSSHPDTVIDISGLEEKLDTAFKSGVIFEYLKGNEPEGFEQGSYVKTLTENLENKNFANALTAFLEATRRLKEKEGVTVDLMGKDNLVIVKNQESYQAVLNNSAIKCDMEMKPDFFVATLLQQLKDHKDEPPTRYLAYFSKFITSVNMLCRLAKVPDIYDTDPETLNIMKNYMVNYFQHPEE